ncbi:MAG: lipopolysaccharide heptosyltransferase II [Candidatus Omnitrophota bacterium]
MKIDKKKVKSILFITLNNLGDIVLTTPVFMELCREFPEAVIDVVTGVSGKEIFVSHPAVRNVAVHKKRKSLSARISQIFEFRRKKYDLIIDLKNSLVPYLIGAKYHTTLYALIMEFTRRKGAFHKKDQHLMKLKDLGIKLSESPDFFIPVKAEDVKHVDDLFKDTEDSKKVIVSPGSKSHIKRWPTVRYAELSDKLVAELGCKIFFIGNKEDDEVINNVTRVMKQNYVNLCGRTSVPVLFELMRHSDIVITGDSAPLHIASAVKVPIVAIFGPTDDNQYGPLSGKSETVKPNVRCRPCNLANCSLGYDKGCIEQIRTSEVFHKVKRLLNKNFQ